MKSLIRSALCVPAGHRWILSISTCGAVKRMLESFLHLLGFAVRRKAIEGKNDDRVDTESLCWTATTFFTLATT